MRRWPILIYLLIVPLLSIIPSTSRGFAATNGVNGVDPNIGAPISVGRCATDGQLDCIVSVKIIRSDGSTLDGNPQDIPCLNLPEPQGTIGRAKEQCQPPFTESAWHFTLPDHSLVSMGVGASFATPTWHQTPQTIISGLNIGVQVPDFLHADDVVELKIKTSWLVPTVIEAHARNLSIVNDDLPGGHLLTLRASFANVASMMHGDLLYAMNKNPSGFYADVVAKQWNITFSDISAVYGPRSVRQTCFNGHNFPAVSSNVQTAGTPGLDRKGNLVIQIVGPHFLPDKQSLNIGYYQADVPVGKDSCAFKGSTLIGATTFAITVLDQDGKSEVTTNSISVDANQIAHFRINGIHFSSPLITIKGVTAKR